ncbi:hypothetical protein JW890_06620 [candidate division WOR-3 bacterium]|nr:hypothetical protein [candidate division WOR-3 bacterium]
MTEKEIKKLASEKSAENPRYCEKLVFSEACGIERLEEIFSEIYEKYVREQKARIETKSSGETVKYIISSDNSFFCIANYRSKNSATKKIQIFLKPDLFVSAHLNTDYFESCVEVEIKSGDQKRVDRFFYILTEHLTKNHCELLQISS